MARRPKVRPRGVSDLGRPGTLYNGKARQANAIMSKRAGSSIGTQKTDAVSQIVSGALLPLPWLLSSLSYKYNVRSIGSGMRESGPRGHQMEALVHACAICAASLLAVATIRTSQLQPMKRDKPDTIQEDPDTPPPDMPLPTLIKATAQTVVGLLTPTLLSIQLGGGISTALALVVAYSCGLAYGVDLENVSTWLKYKGKLASLATVVTADYLFGSSNHPSGSIWTYGFLLVSLFWLPNPLLTVHAPTWQGTELSHTGMAGAVLCIGTILGGIASYLPVSWLGAPFFVLSFTSSAAAILFIEPRHFYNRSYVATGTSAAVTFALSLLFELSLSSFLLSAVLCLVAFAGAWFDSGELQQLAQAQVQKDKSHEHTHDHKKHSRFTGYLLGATTPGSMLHDILSERDSRRIAYFGCLNLCFMLVQFFYGFVTGSLGLLTDSIHMLFDCLGLAVGLSAAVMSKWPPTVEFPYGYAKIDTLSGFANGIFLILVSVEIIFDALHRLREGYELRRLNELLIVSILGFLVNIVGLTAFGHAHHHGHSHGHDHGHSHNHNHAHSDSHDNVHHNHNESNHQHDDHKPSSNLATPAFPPFSSPPSPNVVVAAKDHGHSHANENMQGIFLHILADALGSVAVIVSTILTKVNSWNGWDPLASCIIAVLIFFSAIPLVKSSGSRLLLSLSDEAEYSCRGVLQGISELRGVVGYAGVRLWMADQEAGGGNSHNHNQNHHHEHEHEHEHEPEHEHKPGHDELGHEHTHDEKCNGHHGSSSESLPKVTILGVIHVVAAPTADIDDVRDRVEQYFRSRGMDIVVHVEKEGDGRCWCGTGMKAMASPMRIS